MTPPTLEDAFLGFTQYAVLGAGRSGIAACRLLISRAKRVRLIDEAADASREDLRGLVEAGVELRFGDLGEDKAEGARRALAGCEGVVVSPGFAWDHPLQIAAREAKTSSLSELELGWLCRGGARIAAITGTNGKTTVTMLVEQMLIDGGLHAKAAGNIGFALSAAVLEAGERLSESVFAVEVSSFQLETIERFSPEVAVILNITPDHLDRHGTMEAYARAKQRLTDGQGAGDVLIINQDDPWCLAIAQQTRARVRRFSLTRPVEDGAWLDGDMIMMIEPEGKAKTLLEMDELQMLGLHNVANAMAAACVGQSLGIGLKKLAATLKAFKAAPHRLEPIAEIDGVRYVNDSKGTNLDAMVQAIESFEGDVLLIAGGRDKNSPYATVAGRMAKRVKEAFLIGEAAALMEPAWGGSFACTQCGTMDKALEAARAKAHEGDVVLLSPGCASFDQFKNYAQRGEIFAGIVRGWKSAGPESA